MLPQNIQSFPPPEVLISFFFFDGCRADGEGGKADVREWYEGDGWVGHLYGRDDGSRAHGKAGNAYGLEGYGVEVKVELSRCGGEEEKSKSLQKCKRWNFSLCHPRREELSPVVRWQQILYPLNSNLMQSSSVNLTLLALHCFRTETC